MIDIEEPRKVSNHWSYMSDDKFDSFMRGFLRFIAFKSVEEEIELKLLNDMKTYSIPFIVNWMNELVNNEFHIKFPYTIPQQCEWSNLPDDPTIRPCGYTIWRFKIYDVVIATNVKNTDMLLYQSDGFDSYAILDSNQIFCVSNKKCISYDDFFNIIHGIHMLNQQQGGNL